MMKRGVLFALLLALLCGSRAAAARIDTLSLDSRVLNRPVTVVAVLPDGASEHHPAPLLLLLHGYGGDAFSWLKIKTGLPALVDRTGIALLCPDGGQSWYMDSPVDTTSRYESFLVGELIPYADVHLPVARDARHRAVAGLSMGGFGAMRLGLLHPDLFGAAGSMSGGLDIRPFPGRWELDRLLGRQSESPENWERMTPINLIAQLDPARTPALIIDCGYDDFIFEVNRAFHRELRRRGIPHDFCVRPGGHELSYWANAIDYQMLFFSKFFAAADAEEERAFDGGSSAAASSDDGAAAPAAASDARPEAQTGR